MRCARCRYKLVGHLNPKPRIIAAEDHALGRHAQPLSRMRCPRYCLKSTETHKPQTLNPEHSKSFAAETSRPGGTPSRCAALSRMRCARRRCRSAGTCEPSTLCIKSFAAVENPDHALGRHAQPLRCPGCAARIAARGQQRCFNNQPLNHIFVIICRWDHAPGRHALYRRCLHAHAPGAAAAPCCRKCAVRKCSVRLAFPDRQANTCDWAPHDPPWAQSGWGRQSGKGLTHAEHIASAECGVMLSLTLKDGQRNN